MLITFVARTYYIPSGSMLPTLQIHDVLLVDKFEYRFHPAASRRHRRLSAAGSDARRLHQARDRPPGRPLRRQRRHRLHQRHALNEPYVAEKPDYELEIRDYGIYVSYGAGWQTLDPASANVPPQSQWTAPDRIPPHCYFMFGDNRNDSEDSHVWGFAQDGGPFRHRRARRRRVPDFTGRAFLIFWPPSQARTL